MPIKNINNFGNDHVAFIWKNKNILRKDKKIQTEQMQLDSMYLDGRTVVKNRLFILKSFKNLNEFKILQHSD